MEKRSNKKISLILLLTLLSLSLIFTALTPTTRAMEISNKDKGLIALNIALDLNLTEYSITTNANLQKESNLGVYSQEDILYTLISNDNILKVLCTFVDGRLQIMQVLENEGSPDRLHKEANTDPLVMTKDFLTKI